MKKNTLLLIPIVFLLFMQIGFAQIKTADKLYNRFAYSKAIPYYLKIANSKDDGKRDAAISRLAECYRLINNYEQSVYWYQEAVKNPETDTINYFYLGTVLRNLSHYDEAKVAFLKFAELKPSDPRGKKFAGFCEDIEKWKDISTATIKNKDDLNSEKSDFSPVIDNGSVVFTSDRGVDMLDNNNYTWTGNAYLDLYSSKPETENSYLGKMSVPEKLSKYFNKPFHDGPACFTKDNKFVFITRTQKDLSKRKKMRTDLLAIYYANINEEKPDFKPFPYNSEDYSVCHPAISPDGVKLVFSSDMSGGEGGSDLYISRLENGEWTTPQNLGKEINTFGNEVFPGWFNDSTLFFSSDSRMGYGGLDIYKTNCSKDTWTVPVNLQSPINSSYDDFGIVFLSDTEGFFSSDRPGGKGFDDIYQFSGFQINQINGIDLGQNNYNYPAYPKSIMNTQ
ncbi:MAG: hypothetical protein R2757_22260 [Draconibacterium sp.]